MIGTPNDRSRARRSLDSRLAPWRGLPNRTARPPFGWVRAVREALGMTTADLADRMNVAQSTVTRLERSERTGTIQLDTLTRAAEAMDCDVVYAVVPRRPLDDVVRDQARRRATEQVRRLGHTMALEDQTLDRARLESDLALFIDHYLNAPGLWHRAPGDTAR